ncbi:MAG: 23S rRNA (adenine(2503)-C(2))-methyltransferase RlmN [Spirochaetales bacterium]|nr:23S rRNA (adenine(2503)-C(2))-methyltransferase RlmN [Spirochaetales bacterium]
MDKINILEQSREALLSDMQQCCIIDKPYRLDQILQSIYKNCVLSFDDMTNLSISMRESLSDRYNILGVREEQCWTSSDGTIKFLFELCKDRQFVESVYLKDKNNRVTFCVSSQVGCRMGCTFCKTGRMGLIRNLTAGEIISEVMFLWNVMKHDESVTDKFFNIVFMGMGEPLDNIDNLCAAIDKITNQQYIGMSQTRITISTCGLVDKIESVLIKFPQINFALSLNSSRQEQRLTVMPAAKLHSISEMKKILDGLAVKYKTRFTLEYVMIAGFNICYEDAAALKCWTPKHYLINLIPLNHSDEHQKRPNEHQITKFADMLQSFGLKVTRRYRRGADIQADCGQLFLERAESMRNNDTQV